ncbi:ATP-binding cassette domain-containing protein [Kribbella sp. NPDC026596]|uniref:ATP-binding cassette domain-containing protein n=1 Tax=Kribbella sp. NPDC026596 TaxID=3155122 RepID=UPI0033ED7CD4
MGRLSVGQRRRLALALLIADPPELLLLDEPTNHLSPLLADELEQVLGTTLGATVLATHDRWLRTRWPHPQLRLTART